MGQHNHRANDTLRPKDEPKNSSPLCDVLFATPTLSHQCAIEFKNSCIETDRLLIHNGFHPAYIDIGGDPYLHKVRNKLVTKFLDDFPNTETFFFLDDDISWPAHKALELIMRPEDVVAGVYPKKSDDLDFPVQLLADAKTGELIRHQGLVAAAMVPTGFLRIKRRVLERMATTRPKYLDIIGGKECWFYDIFQAGVNAQDHKFYGEDPAFCVEWRALGGDIWVDPDIQFTHRGSKRWANNLIGHIGGFKTAREEAA